MPGSVVVIGRFRSSRVMLISTTLRRRGSGSTHILFHCRGYALLGWARLHIVPGAKSVGLDRTRHDDDESHLGLIQLDLSTKGVEGHDGTDQNPWCLA